LSIDEISSLHERLIKPVRENLGTSGLLFSAWVIPYGLALILFVAGYLKFLLQLPKKIMYLFCISGAVFVAGAIGLELFEGHHYERHGSIDLTFAVFYTVEEFLEMFGIVLFIYTLLAYIETEFGPLKITVDQDDV